MRLSENEQHINLLVLQAQVRLLRNSATKVCSSLLNDTKHLQFTLISCPVLSWYHYHSLPVQPITPSRPSISVSGTTYATITSPSVLPHPGETSLSIITQPSITKNVLREAKEKGVKAVWYVDSYIRVILLHGFCK